MDNKILALLARPFADAAISGISRATVEPSIHGGHGSRVRLRRG
jgi:hypothetical protein